MTNILPKLLLGASIILFIAASVIYTYEGGNIHIDKTNDYTEKGNYVVGSMVFSVILLIISMVLEYNMKGVKGATDKISMMITACALILLFYSVNKNLGVVPMVASMLIALLAAYQIEF